MKPEASQKVGGEEHLQDAPKSSLRIAAVCGSLSTRSTTKMALSLALKGASEYEVSTKLIELRDYRLVFYGQVAEEDYPLDVLRLRKEIKESHALIIGTPEYHGSLSGALKNMLDLMSAEEFEGKIVGLVGVAGGHLNIGRQVVKFAALQQKIRQDEGRRLLYLPFLPCSVFPVPDAMGNTENRPVPERAGQIFLCRAPSSVFRFPF